MIVGALQPGFLPWLGFFEVMKQSDLFVVEDSLKYTKQDWRNRNRIRTAKGTSYLTVPVEKDACSKNIRDVRIAEGHKWQQRHLNILRTNYGRAPYWKQYEAFLEETYERSWEFLLDLDMHWMEFLVKEFRIRTPYKMLNDLGVRFGPDKTASLVELTLTVGADTLYEGASGRAFIDVAQFEAAGLQITFQDYQPQPYRQQFEPFISHLSAIDLLLNDGPDGARFI